MLLPTSLDEQKGAQPLSVRALGMTVGLPLPAQMIEAHVEIFKREESTTIGTFTLG
jgi:hypothetical protein